MSYTGRAVRRIAQGIPTLVGLSMLIFVMSRVPPGDPVRLALGPTATQEMVDDYARELGLHKPIYQQYLDWAAGVLQGRWGESVRTGNDVFFDISVRYMATLELVLVSVFIASVLAILLGVVAGMNQDKWQDHAARIGALFGVSMPRFWLAIILQLIFAVWLDWFPLIGRFPSGVPPPQNVTGFYLLDSLLVGEVDKFWLSLKHILLPALALGTGTLAQVARLLRSNIIEVDRQDYIMNARASGMPEKLVRYKYILKNSFTAALTVIGLEIGALMGGAFFVEVIFAWPGVAFYGVRGILFQDLNAIVGITIVIGATYLVANIFVDLLYSWLDPRLRLEGQ